jgi:hypothetical protein
MNKRNGLKLIELMIVISLDIKGEAYSTYGIYR